MQLVHLNSPAKSHPREDCDGIETKASRGCSMLRNLSHGIVLYTRRDCHLCDDSKRLLEEEGLEPECIDIDSDAVLRARFDACVPVVEIDGKTRFRGQVDARLLRRLLRGRVRAESG